MTEMDCRSDTEQTRICVGCCKTLPLSMFYKHPNGKFGHFNKCKECVKAEARSRYDKMSQDENWIEKERARGREKFHRLGYKDIYKSKHPEASNVARNLRNILKVPTTHEIHHWNYNLLYDVFILDKRIHSRFHKKVLFDEESKCFLYNGELLDTKEKHEKAIREITGLSDNEEIIKFAKD